MENKMIKDFSPSEIMALGNQMPKAWEEDKGNITLTGKDLYNLIGIKKLIMSQHDQIQEAIITFGEQLGGTYTEEGLFKIPPDKVDDFKEWSREFYSERISVSFDPIQLGAEDSLPPLLMDALYDFIVFKN